MSNNSDDDWSLVFIVLLVIGGLWWAYDNYEIVEKDADEAGLTDQAIQNIINRPVGPVTFATSKHGTTYTLEPATVTGESSSRRGWITQDHSKDATVPARTTKELVWVNCGTGETRTLSKITYDKDGDVLRAQDFKFDDAAATYFPPRSIGASFTLEMCKAAYNPIPE